MKKAADGGDDEKVDKREYHLLPDFKLPDVEEAAVGVAEAAALDAFTDESVSMTATRHWRCIGAESIYPYWVVSRWTIAELRKWQTVEPTSSVRFNMDVALVQRMAMSVSCSSRSIAHSVNIPILTNTVALRKGDQVCLEVVPKAVTKKRKVSAWKTDALKSKAAAPTAAVADATCGHDGSQGRKNTGGMTVDAHQEI